MLALTEKQMLIQALGRVVYDEVQIAVAPFKNHIERIEKIIGDLPVPRDGADGKDGRDGKDAVIPWDELNEQLQAGFEMLDKQITEKIDALPKAVKGEKGDKGDKGEKGEPGENGKDGSDGRDGIDGKSVSMDDVRSLLDDLVAKAVANIPIPRNCVGGYIDRAGHLFLSFSDGCHSDLGPVVGRDGKDCDLTLVRSQVAEFLAAIEKPKDGNDGKDGKDGVGFDDLILEYDGARLVSFKFVKGENAKVYNIEFPLPIYQGIWRDGEYSLADVVTRDGSMWICKKETKTMPGSPESDWQLCTKRGRDGKDGKTGPQGPEGKAGRNGRDLTQMGTDGQKW